MREWKRRLSIMLAVMLVFAFMPAGVYRVQAASAVKLTFSDSGIAETVAGSGYSIEGTALTIESAGVYKVTGSCASGSISVKKELTGVVLILDDLTLSSSATAPIEIKKSSSVIIHLDGTSTLKDDEDTSLDTAEGVAIKVKSGSSLAICGDGTLNVYGNTKNGIKGAAASSLLVNSGTIQVKNAVKNAIAFDGNVTIKGGKFVIASSGDGIKAMPEEDSTETEEKAAAESADNGNVTISGGSFDINVDGDGIVAQKKLTIDNGSFDITTMKGYNDSSFNKSSMSCKGLKVSSDLTSVTEEMVINGGSFTLNTPDDAIHSDANLGIYGGTFTISTGDDGVHSDTYLQLGKADGLERDPDITVKTSYEGLESGTINSYSGRYHVTASDDGLNAGGGSGSGTDPGFGGNDKFNPGGGPGGFGGGGFGGGGFGGGMVSALVDSASGSYALNLAGGEFYVNCGGDGLDSNGTLSITGGTYTVLSQEGGRDNSPLDSNSTPVISGGTVFAAGGQGMDGNPTISGQKYKIANTSYSAGSVIAVSSGGNVVHTEKLTKNVNYILYTDSTVSSPTIGTGSFDACKSNSWAHNWDAGATSGSVTTYTCKDCGAVERQTVKTAETIDCGGHESSESGSETTTEETTADPYTAAFAVSVGATIDIYYTQDYTTASETNVTTAKARNGSTGDVDSTGEGQINFKVNCPEGYEVDSVTATEGKYKNLKDQGNNIWRLTKVTGDLTITVTLKVTETSGTETTGGETTKEETGGTETTGGETTKEETGGTETAGGETNTQKESSQTAENGSGGSQSAATGSQSTATGTQSSTASGSQSTAAGSQSTTTSGTQETTAAAKEQVKVGKNTYKISGTNAVLQKTDSSVRKLTVPATISVNGKTYKVVSIAANAFKSNKKLKEVVIGKNVKSIGKKAFYNCKKLKKITIRGNVKSIGKSAFKGIKSGAVIKVSANKKNVKKIKKLITKSGVGKKVKIK